MGSVDRGIRVLLALTAIFVAGAFVKENVIFFIVGLILAMVFLGLVEGDAVGTTVGVTYAGGDYDDRDGGDGWFETAEGIRRALPGAGEDG